MQLNQATDYAFRVVLFLARLPLNEVASSHVIADRQDIPLRYLQKITRQLAVAGLIKSYRGVVGGFALAKPAQEITLYDVIVAMEGPLAINHCLPDGKACSLHHGGDCPVHQSLVAIEGRLKADLASVTFAALAAKSK